MNPNVTVTFRHLPASQALTEHIEVEAASLQAHCGQPVTFRVTVEPVRTTTHLKRCHVHIEAVIRGATLNADRTPAEHTGHDDPYLAVREAFRSIRRQLDARSDRHRAQRHAHVA